MCAGATGFEYHRFLRTDLAAVVCWVAYGMMIGFASGATLGPINPLLAAVVGMTGGVLLSLLLDRLVSWGQNRFRTDDPAADQDK